MTSPRTMLCAYCCSTRRWPDDFPSSIEACCRECWAKFYTKPPARLFPDPAPLWARVRAWLASSLGAGTKERT